MATTITTEQYIEKAKENYLYIQEEESPSV